MPAKKTEAVEQLPTSIRFPVDLKTWIEKHANEKGWYVSFLITEVMKAYRAQQEALKGKKK